MDEECAFLLPTLWLFTVVLIGALASIPLIVFGEPNTYIEFCTPMTYYTCTCHNLRYWKINIGIRGFANLEECAIGGVHSLDAFNFLTGLLFVIVFLVIVLVLIFFTTNLAFSGSNWKANTAYFLVAFLLIASTIIGFGDIVYSFYTASQVYGQYDEFQQGLVNCSSSVYYSSFVSVVIVFLYISVEIALVVLLCLWLICDFRYRIGCWETDWI